MIIENETYLKWCEWMKEGIKLGFINQIEITLTE